MLRKNVIAIAIILFCYINSNCQVNLQTGSAVYSLPVFSWSDVKSKLNLNVGLNYNSGNGLRTNQVASNVGQGWNLLAGGSISRIQNGEPDDQMASTGIAGAKDDLSKCPAGYLYNNLPASNGCPNALTRYPIFGSQNELYTKRNSVEGDRELDYFSFDFNGKSGVFVLNKFGYGVSLADNRMIITYTTSPGMTYNGKSVRTTISAFTIKDENGLIYKFNKLSYVTILRTDYCDDERTEKLIQPTFDGGGVYHEAGFIDNTIINPYLVNGWYLTEVEDALTHRKITYNYVDRNIDAFSGYTISYYATKNYIILSHGNSKTVTPSLTSIVLPADDGHSVDFNYGDFRVDLNGDKTLAEIDIKYKGRFMSKYKLNTSYFILNRYGSPTSDYQKKMARLCLKSVTQYGVDLKSYKEPYLFDYYTGSNNLDDIIPPPFSLLKDIWGYYNGDESKNFYNSSLTSFTATVGNLTFDQLKGLCYLRNGNGNTAVLNPKNNYAQNGLLKQINYPGGGRLIYEYEQNNAEISSVYRAVGGVHVLKTKLTDGGHSNDCDHPLITNYSYVKSGTSLSSMWGWEYPKNYVTSSSHYEPEDKHWDWDWGHPLGYCYNDYEYPGILAKTQAVDLTEAQQQLINLSYTLGVVSTITTILDILNVCLGATGFGAWGALVMDLLGGLATIWGTCIESQSQDSGPDNIFYNCDMNASNSLPVQFSRVVVKEGDGTNGYIAHQFTNPYYGINAYPIWEPTNEIGSMKQRYAYWAYGLPEKTTVFNASGIKLKETENIYDYSKAKVEIDDDLELPGNNLVSCKCKVLRTSSQKFPDWVNPGLNSATDFTTNALSNNDLKAEIYSVYTGRIELAEVNDRTYDKNNSSSYLEQKTKYKYSDVNYQVNQIITYPSSGSAQCVDITYSCEYNTGILNTLKSNNILNLPVTKRYSLLERQGENFVNLCLKEVVSEYTQLNNGDIKLYRTLVERTEQPKLLGAWIKYTGPTATLNPAFAITQYFIYDVNTNNLVQVKDEGIRSMITLYDYDNKFSVANVGNAFSRSYTSYTSFETDNLGGWTLYGIPNYVSTTSVTGDRCLQLSSTTNLTALFDPYKRNRLSFWGSVGGNFSINSNAQLVKSGPTINGFTYFEYEIPENASNTVAISGLGKIDELRLYPADARMKTTTYDPLIGKTSECDENNRLTYFEYNEKGELQLIKDDYKNVVKMYENNVRKVACTGSYTNKLVTETFTKNDCGDPDNFIGTDVTYTIAAGTYTSDVSQDVVDQLVQNDLNANGQEYANTNGTCIPVYWNRKVEWGEQFPSLQKFYKQNCSLGWTGVEVKYVVPAHKYKSLISQADADNKAITDYQSNGQFFANSQSSGSNCVINTNPIWRTVENAQKQCISVLVSGVSEKHLFVFKKDINPNSSTYNQTKWEDVGKNPTLCP